MKKIIYLLSALLLGIILTTLSRCKGDSEETCKQDEICEAKFVTACCTENNCVYKYDGNEYSEDQIGELALDLGCSSSGNLKSGSNNDDLSGVIAQLKSLMDEVRCSN